MWAVIWRILTLTCDESARLMSASLDEDLPWFERVAFRLHAVGCRSCRRLYRQIRFLRSAATLHSKQQADSAPIVPHHSATLSAEARQRIERALRQADNGDDH